MTERILVRDLMTVGVATCSQDAPVQAIAKHLLEQDLEAVVVLNEQGHGVGVVTQDELVAAYAKGQQLTAADIMRDDVAEIPPDIPLSAAAQLMQDQNIRVFFLMHHADGANYPSAVISYRHFLRHLAATDDSELNDLGYGAARQKPLDAYFEKRDAARRADISGQG